MKPYPLSYAEYEPRTGTKTLNRNLTMSLVPQLSRVYL